MPIVQGAGRIIRGRQGEDSTLTRAHLEEDAGKSVHEGFHDFSGIDLNRAGTPLLEIVSEPDMRSAEEAVAYAKALHSLVRWIGICDGNMQEGSFRCDANVSVRPEGSDKLGTRREIKNLNSFRFLEQAIEYEAALADRDAAKAAAGSSRRRCCSIRTAARRARCARRRTRTTTAISPTRTCCRWRFPTSGSRRSGRRCPSCPPSEAARFEIELGATARNTRHCSLRAAKGGLLRRRDAEDAYRRPLEQVANWITAPLIAKLNDADLEIAQSPVTPEQLRASLARIVDGTLSGKMAKEVFDAMWAGEGDADAIIEKRGLKQISDSGELETVCDQVIAANAKQVEDYRAGRDKAFNSLVGQVMKATKGKANPQQVNES